VKQSPLAAVLRRPGLAVALMKAVGDWDDAMRAYKGWRRYGDVLLASLAQSLDGG